METTYNCHICERIEKINRRENPHFVAELATAYVVLGDFQYFRGYTLLVLKRHVENLHDLPHAERIQFLLEMSLVGEAVHRAFNPRKINYELAGNVVAHLHWHIYPRHADDPNLNGPLYYIDRALRFAETARANANDLQRLKASLLPVLQQTARDYSVHIR